MIPLPTQEVFESLLKRNWKEGEPGAKYVVVYFTAPWCGACKKLDLDALTTSRSDVVWYKCNVDENTYSLGYCGLSRIPAFVFLRNGEVVHQVSSSSTQVLLDLMAQFFVETK